MKTFTALIVGVTVPLTVALVVGNRWLVEMLFEGGMFTSQATTLVSSVQLGYLLHIPFYTLGVVAVRTLIAMGGHTTVLKITLVSLTVNFFGNLAFMQWFGVAGIALSTSLMYVGSSTMIVIAVYRRLGRLERGLPIPRPHFVGHSQGSLRESSA